MFRLEKNSTTEPFLWDRPLSRSHITWSMLMYQAFVRAVEKTVLDEVNVYNEKRMNLAGHDR